MTEPPRPDLEAAATNLDRIRARIALAGGDPDRITVVAVTKGLGVEAVEVANAIGLDDIGENYAQELLSKTRAARAGTRWHFLGAVQRNKVAKLAPVVSVWQGVDRLDAGRAIASHSPGAAVFAQVNISGAEGRNGCREEDACALVGQLRELGLNVVGLMAVASPESPEVVRDEFQRMARLRDQAGVSDLSIGMSDDFELAVAAGSTMVRLGRALFGERP